MQQAGDFVWYDLCTTDPEAAAAFYAKVVGWTAQDSSVPGLEYKLLFLGDRPIAGVMTLPPAQTPPRPVWYGYISAEDVDAKAAEIKAAGGNIHKAPQDIPQVGRFAVVGDPQGAVFNLFKGIGEPPESFTMMQNGTIGWNELHTSDAVKGLEFYETQFGWSKDEVHDMGPMGMYQLFKTSGMPVGGVMTDSQAPHPYWLYYFVVEDIDAGVHRLEEHGGTLLFGPVQVPGGIWVIQAKDPQDGVFALVGMRSG